MSLQAEVVSLCHFLHQHRTRQNSFTFDLHYLARNHSYGHITLLVMDQQKTNGIPRFTGCDRRSPHSKHTGPPEEHQSTAGPLSTGRTDGGLVQPKWLALHSMRRLNVASGSVIKTDGKTARKVLLFVLTGAFLCCFSCSLRASSW